MVDFLVVGGGIIGLLTARELRLSGASVHILERKATGRESSWAGGGILSPLYPWTYDDAITALATYSQAAYPQLATELNDTTGIDPQWTQSGFLILDPGDRETVSSWGQRFGHSTEWIEPCHLAGIEPRLATREQPGLWMPEIAQIRNPRLLKALRQDVLNRGTTLSEHSEVTALSRSAERINGVITDRGPLYAATVILTAGAWTAALLPATSHPPAIAPVRGQMILLRTPKGFLERIVLDEQKYLIPRRDGRVLVGSTRENVGFCKQTTPDAYDELIAKAREIAPGLAQFEVEHHWAGLRPGSPRGIPYIGPHPELEGLYVNAGHYRNGLVMGPASARLLTDLALGRETIVPAQPYALDTARPEA